MTINKNRAASIFVIALIIIATVVLFAFGICNDLYSVSLLGLGVTIVLFSLYILTYRKIFTPFLFFSLSFCMFQFGQFYLYALKAPHDYCFFHKFYSSFFTMEDVIHGAQYTLICIEIFFICCFVLEKGHFTKLVVVEDTGEYRSLLNTAKLLFCISLPASMVMTISQVYITLKYSYLALRTGATGEFLSRINIIGNIAIFYVPSLFLFYLLNRNSRKRYIFEFLIVLHAMAYFVIGLRTTALSLLLVLVLMVFDSYNHIKWRYVFLFVLSGFIVMLLSNYIALTRDGIDYGANLMQLIPKIGIQFVGELGWSCYPLLVLMHACPQLIPYSFGLRYLASAVGFFPSIIDPSGVLGDIAYAGTDNWLTGYLGFNFGIGYSLVAESYANFGYLGIIAIVFLSLGLCYIFCRFLKSDDIFGYYTKMIMLYSLFTLPRRGVSELFNNLFYMLFVVWCVKSFIFNPYNKRVKSKSISD